MRCWLAPHVQECRGWALSLARQLGAGCAGRPGGAEGWRVGVWPRGLGARLWRLGRRLRSEAWDSKEAQAGCPNEVVLAPVGWHGEKAWLGEVVCPNPPCWCRRTFDWVTGERRQPSLDARGRFPPACVWLRERNLLCLPL